MNFVKEGIEHINPSNCGGPTDLESIYQPRGYQGK